MMVIAVEYYIWRVIQVSFYFFFFVYYILFIIFITDKFESIGIFLLAKCGSIIRTRSSLLIRFSRNYKMKSGIRFFLNKYIRYSKIFENTLSFSFFIIN